MVKIAIVDDEEIFANKLKQDILKLFEKRQIQCQVYVYTDSMKIIFDHKASSFNLIFLDIDMPQKNGIEIAAEIRKTKTKTHIIFVSWYSCFVFETFKFMTFRFIRKEKLALELPESINSYCDEIQENEHSILIKFEDKISKSVEPTKFIYFFSLRHDIFLYCSANEQVRLANRVYTMDKLENMLDQYGFIRVHKSYLINYRYIYQIKENEIYILPDDNTPIIKIPLSGRRTVEVKKKYQMLTRGDDSL